MLFFVFQVNIAAGDHERPLIISFYCLGLENCQKVWKSFEKVWVQGQRPCWGHKNGTVAGGNTLWSWRFFFIFKHKKSSPKHTWEENWLKMHGWNCKKNYYQAGVQRPVSPWWDARATPCWEGFCIVNIAVNGLSWKINWNEYISYLKTKILKPGVRGPEGPW